jgi:transglutaminase-like putative cysteine protease
MRYRTHHTTTYLYGELVSLCHNEVRLTPRSGPDQAVIEFRLDIRPRPESLVSRRDYFGNTATFFCIQEPHRRLEIHAESIVDVTPRTAPVLAWSPAWEQVKAQTREDVGALQFVFDGGFVQTGDEFLDYALPSFAAGRSLLEAASDLCSRIHAGFKYEPQATQVDTPVDVALRNRRGVCQDFSHVMIACLRSLGLAARYVSGYIRSGDNRVGAEASHAWVSVFCPGQGWIDFDPTNNRLAGTGEHVTLAWGRDYTDVSPMKGVMVGGGEHLVNVSVGVVPEPSEAATAQ